MCNPFVKEFDCGLIESTMNAVNLDCKNDPCNSDSLNVVLDTITASIPVTTPKEKGPPKEKGT